ncbi:MAG: hypothetical protein ACYDCJ_13005 [Gammaproteobacteria bacterium]
MLTAWGVRCRLRTSRVPLAVWAKRLGITRTNLWHLRQGHPAMMNGPAMQRLMVLMQQLEDGEWEFRLKGSRARTANWSWTEPAPPRRGQLRISLENGRLQWVCDEIPSRQV